jgi:hypothetical protein
MRLLILSWLGRYNGSPPTVSGVTLLATSHLPNWQDLAAIAAFSLVIYYWAVHGTLPHQRISAAVADVGTEAFRPSWPGRRSAAWLAIL